MKPGAALQRAHSILLQAMRNVHDEGLRRNYLNKLEVNRDIVRAWLRESARRGLPDTQRLAHLAIESSPSEPFKRQVDNRHAPERVARFGRTAGVPD